MNNVRQLGLSFALYVTDQGMPNYVNNDPPTGQGDWHYFLQPNHRENPKVRICPSTRSDLVNRSRLYSSNWDGTADRPYWIGWLEKLDPSTGLPYWPSRPDGALESSYGMNDWMRPVTVQGARGTPPYFYTETDIKRPSLSPIFGDSAFFTTGPVETSSPVRDLYYALTYPISGILNIGDFQLARHGSSGPAHSSMPIPPGQSLGPWVNNIVFFDGHVDRVKLDNLWQLYWHKNWEPPATRPR